ncbi:hypothetical protein BgiBS90_030930, partial [Biomphalaria glabrata]
MFDGLFGSSLSLTMKMATQVSAVHPYDMQAFIAKSFCCKQFVHLSCNGNSLRTV